MACSDYKLDIYHDSILFPNSQVRTLEGCSGDVVILSATSDLPLPVKFTWSLDGPYEAGFPILSDTSVCEYTFGEENHEIFLKASSGLCEIGKNIRTREKNCDAMCPVACATQVAYIPAGTIYRLTDAAGKFYDMGNSNIVKCGSLLKANLQVADVIKDKVLFNTKCTRPDFKVNISSSMMNPRCLKIELLNSPVKMRLIKVGNISYMFHTNNC